MAASELASVQMHGIRVCKKNVMVHYARTVLETDWKIICYKIKL